jgi:hypothetical protein
LRGAGVGLSLPLLDAMIDGGGPLSGRAIAQAVPTRLVLFGFPNGVVRSRWIPSSEGPDYALTPSLMPIGAHRRDINVISGLRMPNVRPSSTGKPAGHAQGFGVFATGMPVPAGAVAPTGPSLDHVAAESIAGATRIPVLALNNMPPVTVTDGAANNNLTNHLSWLPGGKPFATDHDPIVVFKRLVGAPGGGPGDRPGSTGPASAAARRRSVLDYVRGEATRISGRLGGADRARMDEYLTSVRQIERDLLAPPPTSACTAGAAPAADMAPNVRAQTMIRLITLALRCDLTRSVSFGLTRGFDLNSLPWIGISEQHHELAHDRPNGPVPDLLTKIVQYEVGQLSYFIDQLKAVREGDGTLYDRTLVYFGSDMSTGGHAWDDMPVILAGRGGGRMRSGLHVRHQGVSINRLFLALLHLLGVEAKGFGSDGTSPLPGLFA